ncbi:MAG: metallophosphoesterase [Cyanobacteria bacterium P01_F01_bin.150]
MGVAAIREVTTFMENAPVLLTDPFLQRPTETSVNIVWFTEFPGVEHRVDYGETLSFSVEATTTQLSRTREDEQSYIGTQLGDGSIYSQPTLRPIWRHEVVIPNLQDHVQGNKQDNVQGGELSQGQNIPYRVTSLTRAGRRASSDIFALQALPQIGQPLNILLTSDHQLKAMTPANTQAVVETVGRVDAVLMAGDLVNISDRASEWFDDSRGKAFFPALQGRAGPKIEQDEDSATFAGGALIQSAPIFTAIGNHEVMGRWSMTDDLNTQFNDPVPRAIAQQNYQSQADRLNPANDSAVANNWMTNQSFNTITYDEIFSLPKNDQGHSKYYAVTLGNVRLVVLYITNIWRPPSLHASTKGRYREADNVLHDQSRWGYGQHIFEPIGPGSKQYEWLVREVRSPSFTNAKYKLVMFHHPPHSLGDNIVPAYTDPVQMIDRFEDGTIKAVRYEYPKHQDYLMQHVVPLLESAGVDLTFFGHSHVWNRFVGPTGIHFLESSNVGNTYGAFWRNRANVELDGSEKTGSEKTGSEKTGSEKNANALSGQERRHLPIGYSEDYVPWDDPNGLEPVMPNIAPLVDDLGQPQPFIASNDITVFSILNTGTGLVSSYRFDTRTPEQPAIKFDEFSLD